MQNIQGIWMVSKIRHRTDAAGAPLCAIKYIGTISENQVLRLNALPKPVPVKAKKVACATAFLTFTLRVGMFITRASSLQHPQQGIDRTTSILIHNSNPVSHNLQDSARFPPLSNALFQTDSIHCEFFAWPWGIEHWILWSTWKIVAGIIINYSVKNVLRSSPHLGEKASHDGKAQGWPWHTVMPLSTFYEFYETLAHWQFLIQAQCQPHSRIGPVDSVSVASEWFIHDLNNDTDCPGKITLSSQENVTCKLHTPQPQQPVHHQFIHILTSNDIKYCTR